MSKSLEALEELKIYLPAIYSEVAKCLNTIKQDLERLELTEALYNNTLKEMKTIKDDDRKLYLKFKDLEKENQKLENFIKWLKDDDGILYIKDEILDKLKELGLYKEVNENGK